MRKKKKRLAAESMETSKTDGRVDNVDDPAASLLALIHRRKKMEVAWHDVHGPEQDIEGFEDILGDEKARDVAFAWFRKLASFWPTPGLVVSRCERYVGVKAHAQTR